MISDYERAISYLPARGKPLLQPGDTWQGRWRSWAISQQPDFTLALMRRGGHLAAFPLLQAMVGCQQDVMHHPEGDVFVHTLHTIANASSLFISENLSPDRFSILMMAALLHDCGKPTTMVLDHGSHMPRFPLHHRVGAELADTFLREIEFPDPLRIRVVTMVREHMNFASVRQTHTPRGINRLVSRIEPVTLDDMELLYWCDINARPRPIDRNLSERWTSGLISYVHRPLFLRGQHLLDAGIMQPGPEMGRVLDEAEHARSIGMFSTIDEGLDWVRQYLALKDNS